MADISVRGYVNKPGTFKDGKYSRFTLSEKIKGRNGGPDSRAFYSVVSFDSGTPPAESSFVTVKGRLTVNTVEKEGKRYTNLDVVANEIEVAPPREATTSETAALSNDPGASSDPWDN